MLLRKAALILGVILAVAAIGLAVWFWNTQNRLYSSPIAPRTNDAYAQCFAPPARLPPVPTNLYSSFQIDRDTNRIVVSSPVDRLGSDEKQFVPLTFVHADDSHTAHFSNSSVRLAYIGSASAQPRTNFEWGLQVPAAYYTPDAKPITSAASNELKKILPAYQHNLSFDGSYPASQFVFISSNIASLKTLGFAAYDARTHYGLTSGYSSSAYSNGFYFANALRMWHQAPVMIVATIATGPVHYYPLSTTEGTELDYPHGHIRLLIKTEDDLGSWSSTHDGRSNIVSFKLQPHPYLQNRKTCSFVFHSWPQGNSAPIDFEFLNAAGKKLNSYRSGSSGHLLTSSIEGSLDDVKEIRLAHYPNVYRLVFTIPELPGLPEQNRNIENLFDVHIPYMYFRYEYDFQYQAGHLLQMNQQHFALTFPNGYFPTFRTNITPREMFLEMEKLLANPNLHLVADPEKNEVAAKPHPIAAAIEAIKTKLKL
jgi:hypothetical protein